MAGGEAAGHGNKVLQHEPSAGLLNYAVDHVGDGHPLHWIEGDMAANMGYGLENRSPDRRVFQAKLHQRANLVYVHVSFDGRDDHGVQTHVMQPVQRFDLGFQ